MKTARFEVLSQREVERINAASMEILADVGIRVDYGKARELFGQAGAQVDEEKRVVHIPARLIQEAVEQAPSTFTLYGNDPEFQVEIGDKIRAKLCSNPTTGFKWEDEMSNENVLKEEDYDFEEPEGDVVGAPGIEVWTFEAVNKGTTEVRMAYSQLWEGGEKEEWTYTMTVTVE